MGKKNSSQDSLRVMKHSTDGDLLVRDPKSDRDGSPNLAFFSSKQLRVRTFAPDAVEQYLNAVADEAEISEAESRFKNSAKLKAKKVAEQAKAAEEKLEGVRANVLKKHETYLACRGIEFEGVKDSSLKVERKMTPQRRRTSCHKCKIDLDDFTGTRCNRCDCYLCSCGACGCGAPKKT